MIKHFPLQIGLIVALLLSACGGGTPIPESGIESVPNAWIDSPLEGTTFPLGEIEIISHTQDLSGIARVELSANGQVIRTDENPASSLTLFVIGQKWIPSEPGNYLVQVRGQTTGGAWSDYAHVNIIVVGATAVPSLTPTLVPTFTPTFTPTPVRPPTFTFIKNAFCRTGPSVEFPDRTGMAAGEVVDILNISEDGFWYFVYWKKFDVSCWVASGAGEADGELSGVAVLAGPTLPVPSGIAPPACLLACPAGCEPNPACSACQAISGGSCKP